ncbi:MAG: lysylphosphatidylglycerol synthase transmembrane domain-containing protein [Acidobacteriota bacterium]
MTAIFLFFFFRSVDWKEVLKYLTSVDIKFFVLIVILVPLHFITRAIRWKVLLKQEKPDVSLYSCFAGNAIGFSVTMIFPGRLGELVKPLYLAQKENIRKGFSVGTVVVERIFDIFTMSFLLGLFLAARPFYAPTFQLDEASFSRLSFLGLTGLGLAFILVFISLILYFFRGKALNFIAVLLKPFPQKISEKIIDLGDEFIQGLKFFHSLTDFFLYLLLSFVVWLSIIFYHCMFFFTYSIHISYFRVFPYVFLILIGASIPTPGMVGGFHYFSKLGLTSLYGIDSNMAVGMTIVIHAVQVAMTCLTGYVILGKEGLSLFQVKKMREEAQE